jgi:phosphosulfolactate synthase (CoM biosynthesis protein A)/phosphosulfolactate phosphohydrolase-like enzyme
MVLDKNLSVSELEHLVDTASDYMDLVKFGWCTSAIFPRDIIRQKCEILRARQIAVCPGGTLMELAFLQGRIPELLKEAGELGFSCIEVSNGSIPMTEGQKLDCIKRALDAGFKVVSEVGSKIAEEDQRLHVEQRIEQTRQELECGAWKVIVEARESGTLGIFDSKGKMLVDMFQMLIQGVPVDDLIFEAPLKQQQVDLILKLGNRVNLGNIPPAEVIALETLRLGLRGDTIRHYHLLLPAIKVELGASGALAASHRGDVIIVVDAIRASSTIITALANGVRSVIPVATVEDCIGEVTAGERGGKKIAQLDHDNSPLVFDNGRHRGKQLVLTTSNGTECILAAASNPKATVLVGALLNVTAVAGFALETARTTGRNLSIVVAGRNNQPASEDVQSTSEMITQFHGAPVQTDIDLINSEDFVLDFLNSESGRNLSSLGLSEEVIFCAQKDKFDVVPIFRDGQLVLTSDPNGC